MTSILVILKRIYRNQFQWNYLKNKKLFTEILLRSQNLHKIWNILNKIMSPTEMIDSEKRGYLNT